MRHSRSPTSSQQVPNGERGITEFPVKPSGFLTAAGKITCPFSWERTSFARASPTTPSASGISSTPAASSLRAPGCRNQSHRQ